MSGVGRAVVVALLVATGGLLAACSGGDDDDADATPLDGTTTTRERGLTVCSVEDEVDRIRIGDSPAGDFEAQRQNAITYIDEVLAVRDRGRAPDDIAADYASVSEAYEVVRAGFEAATTPEQYLTEVEQGALAAFGTREEVDRFLADYTAWVTAECGADPTLGIQLFAD